MKVVSQKKPDPSLEDGDTLWLMLLVSRPYDAALPRSLSDSRLQQVREGRKTSVPFSLQKAHLLGHLITARYGFEWGDEGHPSMEQVIALEQDFGHLIEVEHLARQAGRSTETETEDFLVLLDEVCRRGPGTKRSALRRDSSGAKEG